MHWLELDADELRQREPALDRRYTFGVLVEENGQCRDPGAYVAALVRHAQALGAELRRAAARRLPRSRPAGCARCAPSRRRDRMRQGGDRRRGAGRRCWPRRRRSRAAGNRARLPRRDRRPGSRAALSGDAERRQDGCVMTPQGCGWPGRWSWPGWMPHRTGSVPRCCATSPGTCFPTCRADLPPEQVKVWMGHRPSTPDGLPCIGPASGCPDVVHAFGHGHVGLTAGAATGAIGGGSD